MSSPAAPQDHTTRPLDVTATALTLMLCLSWGLNQVAMKMAILDFPPFIQGAIRSVVATLLVVLWCRLRGIKLLSRDGTLWPGLAAGLVFGLEFLFIYQGLAYTTATRAVLFLYLAPFFVVLGGRIFLPADRFKLWQWAGLLLSFAGMLIAFGIPTPPLDPRQTLGDLLVIGGALFWAATTIIIKASRLNTTSPEKVMLYQLVVSVPILAAAALAGGERMTHWPSGAATAWLAYQAVWVVSVTYVVWFGLIKNYSANRLSAFTFLTPLFGVAAGHLVMGDPVTLAFLSAVALVAVGLMLVNRIR